MVLRPPTSRERRHVIGRAIDKDVPAALANSFRGQVRELMHSCCGGPRDGREITQHRGGSEAMAGERPLANPRSAQDDCRRRYLAARLSSPTLLRRYSLAARQSKTRIGYFLGVGASGGSLRRPHGVAEPISPKVRFALPPVRDPRAWPRAIPCCVQLMTTSRCATARSRRASAGRTVALVSRAPHENPPPPPRSPRRCHAVRSVDAARPRSAPTRPLNPVTVAELGGSYVFLAPRLAPVNACGLVAIAPASARRMTRRSSRLQPMQSGRGRLIGTHRRCDVRGPPAGLQTHQSTRRDRAVGPTACCALRSFAVRAIPRGDRWSILSRSGGRASPRVRARLDPPRWITRDGFARTRPSC